MIVIDSSVWFDLFNIDGYRRGLAKEFFKIVESKNIPILEPRAFEIEFVALLSRRYGKNEAITIFNTVKDKIVVLPNPDDLAFNVALNTRVQSNRFLLHSYRKVNGFSTDLQR